MKVRLIGSSSITSKKDGKPWTVLAIAYQDPYWNGLKCENKVVAPHMINCDLVPDKVYNVEFNPNGALVNIERVTSN